MSNTIKPKRSSTASSTPGADDLEIGEIAINTADGKLFVKHTDNSIKEISGSGSGGMSDLVDDTSPQLGADLDTNNFNINIDDQKAINFNSGSYYGFINYNSGFNPYGTSNGTMLVSSFQAPMRLAAFSESNILGSNLTNSNFIETNNQSTNTPLTVRTNTGSAFDNLFTIDYQGTATFEKGVVNIKNAGSQSELRLYCESSNAHYASIKAPAHTDFSGNVTLTLPATTSRILSTADGLGSLNNVDAGSPSDNDVLQYDSQDGKWKTAQVSGGGGSSNADTVDNYHLSVVTSMPSSPNSNTIYFVTG